MAATLVRWWRTVQIGSLIFPQWSAVHDTVTFKELQTLFQENTFKCLLVVSSSNVEHLHGVIYRHMVDALVEESSENQDFDQLPVTQVPGLLSTNYELLEMQGVVVGDLEDLLHGGASSVILYRNSNILAAKADDNDDDDPNANINGESVVVPKILTKIHPVAIVDEGDLAAWIKTVEGHHNMSEFDQEEF